MADIGPEIPQEEFESYLNASSDKLPSSKASVSSSNDKLLLNHAPDADVTKVISKTEVPPIHSSKLVSKLDVESVRNKLAETVMSSIFECADTYSGQGPVKLIPGDVPLVDGHAQVRLGVGLLPAFGTPAKVAVQTMFVNLFGIEFKRRTINNFDSARKFFPAGAKLVSGKRHDFVSLKLIERGDSDEHLQRLKSEVDAINMEFSESFDLEPIDCATVISSAKEFRQELLNIFNETEKEEDSASTTVLGKRDQTGILTPTGRISNRKKKKAKSQSSVPTVSTSPSMQRWGEAEMDDPPSVQGVSAPVAHVTFSK
eukprot:1005567_1